MKFRLIALLLIAALLGAVTFTPAVAGRASAAPPVGGTMTLTNSSTAPLNITNATGTVVGTLNSITITGFQVVNGVLSAVGTASYTLNSGPLAGIPQTTSFVAPLQSSGVCTILDLTVGPIHLNLLGLVVDTNTIHLTITAVSGPGNLLGNLLCAVAHLLDNTGIGPLGLIATLLNHLLPAGGLTL